MPGGCKGLRLIDLGNEMEVRWGKWKEWKVIGKREKERGKERKGEMKRRKERGKEIGCMMCCLFRNS